jgi:hypothetical protein
MLKKIVKELDRRGRVRATRYDPLQDPVVGTCLLAMAVAALVMAYVIGQAWGLW